MLGTSLTKYLNRKGHTVFCQGRRDMAQYKFEPDDSDKLIELIRLEEVDIIINLVALTDVDFCEENLQEAYRANVGVVEAIVQSIERSPSGLQPHLVQISSDQVYDEEGPHTEDHVDPCNVYALSKLAGEYVAAKVGATIIRTNFFGRSHCLNRNSLSDWLVNSLRAGESITAFDDVFFSALHIETLCDAIEIICNQRHAGVFNTGCSDGLSKASFALSLAKQLDLDISLISTGSVKDMRLRANRPLDMRMNSKKFERSFGFIAPSFESQIEQTAEEYGYESAAI
jgi:dTDP-4-dehydrorhamnose reductase